MNLFHKLNTEGRLHNNLRVADVLQISELSLQFNESCAEEDVIHTFIRKLLLMNYKARYITTNETNKEDETQQRECNSSEDESDIYDELSYKGKSQSERTDPMDVQMVAFHCADSFLKQLMVTKLSQCQYALPLLVPDPYTQQIEFPLWTFRQINKSWKIQNTNISKTQPIYKAETPMVFFFRFGPVSSSKSQLMNSLINEKHNTFFHRNCPGSSKTRVLMDGVVEIAWFCPSGTNDDKFTDCVAFCNLHGNAGDHEKQLEILTESASVNVVLLPQLDRNERNKNIENLYKGLKPLICLFTEDESAIIETRKGKYKIGLKNRNQAEVSEELKRAINDCLSDSSTTFRLIDLSKYSDIRVDEEDDDECRKGREAAQQMMSLLEKKDLTEIKESFLPHQGKLWHQWSLKNRELHRPTAVETEINISRKHSELRIIRQQQHKTDISEFIKFFIKEMNSHAEHKMLFIKWLSMLLNEHTSADLSALLHKYNASWSTVLKLKGNSKNSEQLSAEQMKLEKISEEIEAATFGLEHIMREIGQIYESCLFVKSENTKEVNKIKNDNEKDKNKIKSKENKNDKREEKKNENNVTKNETMNKKENEEKNEYEENEITVNENENKEENVVKKKEESENENKEKNEIKQKEKENKKKSGDGKEENEIKKKDENVNKQKKENEIKVKEENENKKRENGNEEDEIKKMEKEKEEDKGNKKKEENEKNKKENDIKKNEHGNTKTEENENAENEIKKIEENDDKKKENGEENDMKKSEENEVKIKKNENKEENEIKKKEENKNENKEENEIKKREKNENKEMEKEKEEENEIKKKEKNANKKKEENENEEENKIKKMEDNVEENEIKIKENENKKENAIYKKGENEEENEIKKKEENENMKRENGNEEDEIKQMEKEKEKDKEEKKKEENGNKEENEITKQEKQTNKNKKKENDEEDEITKNEENENKEMEKEKEEDKEKEENEIKKKEEDIKKNENKKTEENEIKINKNENKEENEIKKKENGEGDGIKKKEKNENKEMENANKKKEENAEENEIKINENENKEENVIKKKEENENENEEENKIKKKENVNEEENEVKIKEKENMKKEENVNKEKKNANEEENANQKTYENENKKRENGNEENEIKKKEENGKNKKENDIKKRENENKKTEENEKKTEENENTENEIKKMEDNVEENKIKINENEYKEENVIYKKEENEEENEIKKKEENDNKKRENRNEEEDENNEINENENNKENVINKKEKNEVKNKENNKENMKKEKNGNKEENGIKKNEENENKKKRRNEENEEKNEIKKKRKNVNEEKNEENEIKKKEENENKKRNKGNEEENEIKEEENDSKKKEDNENGESENKNKIQNELNFSSLPSIAAEIMISGFPLELMDGDAAHVPITWISAVLDQLIQKLGDQRVFVLSVLGIQSSGKSTMLNAMFGLQFAVSAGRCTRGAFMQLLRVDDKMKEQLNFDYILVVDTEGLHALELAGRSTRNHDNELATFVVGLANLTLINIFGENPSEMQDILQIVVQALQRMKKARLNPSCVFVHQNISDITAGQKNMEGRRRLQEKLDELTKIAAKDEVCDAECFKDVIRFNVHNDVNYIAQLWEGSPPMAPPNPKYCENIQELKKTIMSHASKSNKIMLADLKDHIKDLWETLLNERFVFSFQNTLEISAYKKLEKEYSKWSWSLRSAMMETENELQNKIESEAILEIEETDIQRQLKKTSEEVKKLILEFFETDKDKDVLIRWKTSLEIKISELQESIVRETNIRLNGILQQQGLKKKINAQRTHHENNLFEKSKELALKLRDKANNEETLKMEFDLLWKQWIKTNIQDTSEIKDIDIMSDVRKILSGIYEECLESWKEDSKIFSVTDFSKYVTFKTSKEGGLKKLLGKVKGMLGLAQTSPEDDAQIRSLIEDVVQQTERMIPNFNISNMGYNIDCIQKLTDYITKRVKEHQEGPVKYMFKNEFFMDLVLSICERSNKMITDQHKVFRDTKDPHLYTEKKREQSYNIFQKYCRGVTSTVIFGEMICQNLKESIEQSVYKKISRDLTDEIRSNCPSLNGNRSNLEKHILKRLAEEEDFDKYHDYIHYPREHFKSFIRDEVSRYITDKFSDRVLPKMKENIKLQQQKIIKAAQESTEHVQVNSGDIVLWLKSFTKQLSDVLVISEKNLSGGKHEVDNFNLLEDVITQELLVIMSDINRRFNRKFPDKLDNKFRPDKLLTEHFCQCCWVRCPFCGAICTNTIENHNEDHSVPFHRTMGQNGWKYNKTRNLSVNICTSSVASDGYFYPNDSDETVPWKEYRRAGGVFADWSITPDLSELPYWKWFVCRFQKDLEKCYKKTFEEYGMIPEEWKKYSKQNAIESLEKYI